MRPSHVFNTRRICVCVLYLYMYDACMRRFSSRRRYIRRQPDNNIKYNIYTNDRNTFSVIYARVCIVYIITLAGSLGNIIATLLTVQMQNTSFPRESFSFRS
jgi:hypothetical protein